MYTLLETCLDKLEIYSFLTRVIDGLSDQHDIAILSHTMLIRLARVAPTAVTQSECFELFSIINMITY